MALTRQQIESIVRNTFFVLEGANQKLGTDAGFNAVDDPLLQAFINQAVTDSNVILHDSKGEEFTNCVVDSDEITIPDAALYVTDVVIFPDYDDDDPPDYDAETAYDKGTPLKKATSFQGLQTYRIAIEDHGIITETAAQNLTGKPNAYFQWTKENDSGDRYDVLKFDRAADHGYYLLVQFVTISDNMTTDESQVNIKDIFQWILVNRTRVLVAESIGDDMAIRRFTSQLQTWRDEYAAITAKRQTPDTTHRFDYYS